MCDKPDKNAGTYAEIIDKTAAMVLGLDEARKLAGQRGLFIQDVTWEDTGRYKGSCVGPNISDMTIQVQDRHPKTGEYRLTCMPVIRTPNFADISADVPLDSFTLLVGNEKGRSLRKVTLRELLGNLREYLTEPGSWKGEGTSLLADRDTHALVSAQACFLPIPRQGKAEFNPVLFNYQSRTDAPAVLAILVTPEGTSTTVIDNKRDGFKAGLTWGQRLFFNQAGKRASLTGERISDYQKNCKAEGTAMSEEESQGLNMVLLVQVPLKRKQRKVRQFFSTLQMNLFGMAEIRARCVEDAVIGHGKVEGPFTAIDGFPIKREGRLPVRVTVQFYKATSNGVLSPEDVNEMAEQIDRVYRDADYVGSLVTQRATGRPAEHEGPKQEPPDWWEDFWVRHERNTGQSHHGSTASQSIP